MSSSARIFCAAFFSLFLLFSTVIPTFAQAPQESTITTPVTNPDVPQNMHTYTQSVMIEVVAALTCQLAGVDPINPNQPCLGIDLQTRKIGYVKDGNGAIGATGQMIGMLLTPPIHSGDYFRYMADNFGFAKKAHAAPACTNGSGFCSIVPLHQIWLVFERIVFFMIILIFVLIGLLIMLRIKIDPRTVMSVENQLPKIIISIVLISMSFAIAGLLIDLMWTSTYVVTNLLAEEQILGKDESTKTIKVINQEIYTPPLGVVNEMYKNSTVSAYPVVGTLGGGVPQLSWLAAGSTQSLLEKLFAPKGLAAFSKVPGTDNCSVVSPSCWSFSKLGDYVGGMIAQIVGWTISWALGAAALIVVFLALLNALIRLWFALITAYAYILLDIVLAPFWIMLGLIPGSPVSIEAWFRDMIAHLSVFPTTIAMFLLGKIFMTQFAAADTTTELFVPPMIGNPNDTASIGAIVGIAIILMTPVVVTMMRDLLKAPTFKYASEVGKSLGAGAAGPGRLMSGGMNLYAGTHFDKKTGGMTANTGTIATFMRSFGFAH